jgi:hypothetical protein
MKTVGQLQAFFYQGDQHVGADRNPDLRLDRVLAGAKKRLDSQMLFDPLEEQLDLPTLAVQVGNQFGSESKVVGQKRDSFAAFVLGHDAAQSGWIVLAGIEDGQHARLIADDIGVGPIHRVRVTPFELGVGLGAGDKKCVGLMDCEQSGEIEIPAIEQIVGTGLDTQQVERVDLVCLAIGDVNESGNRASQVQQGVQLDGRLVCSKRRPRVNRQTQIDRSGVERINGGVQVDGQRILRIQGPRHRNQVLRKVGVDLPWASGICIGQRVARDSLATQAHVVQALGLRTQVDLDVAKRLPIGQLRKSHGQKLVHAGEVLHLVVASVMGNATAKGAQWQPGHELRENKLAVVHCGPLHEDAKNHKSWIRRSNRDQTQMAKNQGKSLTYDVPM